MPEERSPLEHDEHLDTDEEDAQEELDAINRDAGDVGEDDAGADDAPPAAGGSAGEADPTRTVRVINHGRSQPPPSVRVVDGGPHQTTVVMGATPGAGAFDTGGGRGAVEGPAPSSSTRKPPRPGRRPAEAEYRNAGRNGPDNSGH